MRKGVHIEITLSRQPNLGGNRIKWRARIQKIWKQGKAGTVFDAIEEIELEAAKDARRP